MTEKRLSVERKGSVGHVRLHRPDVRNAFNAELIADLTATFDKLGTDRDIRVLVLSGEGKHFCAGADLNWMRSTIDFSQKDNEADSRRLHDMLSALYRFPKPTIAQVHGAAMGGGVGLISCCDITVATEDSFMSLSETRLGIVPAIISPFVVRKIGVANYRAYGVSARRFSANEALRLGLVQEVVPRENLDAAVEEWVKLVLQNGPEAMKMVKKVSEELYGVPSLEHAAETTVRTNARARTEPEGQEGMRAFLEKREPAWKLKP